MDSHHSHKFETFSIIMYNIKCHRNDWKKSKKDTEQNESLRSARDSSLRQFLNNNSICYFAPCLSQHVGFVKDTYAPHKSPNMTNEAIRT